MTVEQSPPHPERSTAPRIQVRLPERAHGPLTSILVRLAVAAGALVATAVIVYFEGDCYMNSGQLGNVSWIDAFYYATVSLSTTGYGDVAPYCESARLVNVVVVTPLRFLFLIVLVGTTVEVLTTRTRQEFRAARWRQKVHHHTVIIGFGVKGRSASRTLVESGVAPSTIVVVSDQPAEITEANRMGFAGIPGDARREEVLLDAVVPEAQRVIIALDRDDTSVLVTLAVRRLAPNATIVSAARESRNATVLRQSGADSVIPTAESAGHLLGLSLLSPVAGRLMEDLLDAGRGLEVVQRPIERSELGVAPSSLDATGQIVLAVIRDGVVHRFDARDIKVLEAGDELVVIRHTGAGA